MWHSVDVECSGHQNGFEHFDLDGFDDFDLAQKFEPRAVESEENRTSTVTGIEAYAEPFLVMYVSVRKLDGVVTPDSVEYRLPRSRWREESRIGNEDFAALQDAAEADLRVNLAALRQLRDRSLVGNDP